MLKTIAQHMNVLGNFCGQRDLRRLTTKDLSDYYGLDKVDVLVLFGGSIIEGGDLFAQAMRENIARHYVIVGGYGHTSERLFQEMAKETPELSQQKIHSEAELFAKYLKLKYDLTPDYLETRSTNCGNNITYLLELLKEHEIKTESILMIQDATMQRRMAATLKKYAPDNLLMLNYAAYHVSVIVENERLTFDQEPRGMWDIEHYLTLLMGEIPRLHDTPEGYGPKGKQFIAHVDMPAPVLAAYHALQADFPDSERKANPAFS